MHVLQQNIKIILSKSALVNRITDWDRY